VQENLSKKNIKDEISDPPPHIDRGEAWRKPVYFCVFSNGGKQLVMVQHADTSHDASRSRRGFRCNERLELDRDFNSFQFICSLTCAKRPVTVAGSFSSNTTNFAAAGDVAGDAAGDTAGDGTVWRGGTRWWSSRPGLGGGPDVWQSIVRAVKFFKA
jgi:hypothetical protein